MKCDNCDKSAEYVFASLGANTQFFCRPCVPWTLQEKLNARELPTIVDLVPTAVEEPVVEETPVEEAPVEPTPPVSKKKKPAVVEEEGSPDMADTDDSDVSNN